MNKRAFCLESFVCVNGWVAPFRTTLHKGHWDLSPRFGLIVGTRTLAYDVCMRGKPAATVSIYVCITFRKLVPLLVVV